jgi:hypothetical protein
LNAKGKEFGVECRSSTHANAAAPALAFDIALNIANLLGHGSSLSALVG